MVMSDKREIEQCDIGLVDYFKLRDLERLYAEGTVT